MARHSGRPQRVTALAAIITALAIAACGGSTAHVPTRTVDVSVRPAPFCLFAQQRRELARNPPQIGLALRNIDVDNFSGTSGSACNQRQVVYWGAPSPLGGDQLAIIVRLFFVSQPASTLAPAPGSSGAARVDGLKLRLSSLGGLSAAQFVTARAVVSTVVGCVAQQSNNLNPVACTRPPVSAANLDARLMEALARLIPQLRHYLG